MRNVTYSVDFGEVPDPIENPEAHFRWWADYLQEKCSDTGFMGLIERIITDGWSATSAVGLHFDYGYGPDGWALTEGHHRLPAAILLCMPEVPYNDYGADDAVRYSTHSGMSGGFDWEF